jgi:hypothetical protein
MRGGGRGISTPSLSETLLKQHTDYTNEYNQRARLARIANRLSIDSTTRFLKESAQRWNEQFPSLLVSLEAMSKEDIEKKLASSKKRVSRDTRKSSQAGDKRERSTSEDVDRPKTKRTSSKKDGDAKRSSTKVGDQAKATSTTTVDELKKSSSTAVDEPKKSSTTAVDEMRAKVNARMHSPMVDYEPSPDPEEQTTKELSAKEQRDKLRELLGSSDEEGEEPTERNQERAKDRSPSQSQPRSPQPQERASNRARSRSRSRSQLRSPRGTYNRSRSPTRTRSRSRERTQAYSRGRSTSVDRRDGDRNYDRHERQYVINTNHDDEREELIAAIHNRTNHWPWMVYYNQTRQWGGWTAPPPRNSYPLYDCSIFRSRAEDLHNPKRRSTDAKVSDKEMISLFLEHRFLKAKKTNNKQPSLESASQAWFSFVNNYVADPEHWRKRLEDARADYARTLPGMRLEIHRLCDELQLPCMVLLERCEVCGPNDPRMPDEVIWPQREGVLLSPTYVRILNDIPAVLWNIYERYDEAFARWQTTNASDRIRTQGQERPRGGSYAAPMSHGRAGSLSNEPNRFVCPFDRDRDGQGAPRQSTASHHSRREVAAAAGERRPRERQLASISESSFSMDSRPNPSSNRDQNSDLERKFEERLSRVERTIEGLLDLDLQMTRHLRDHKLLLGELQRAGVKLPRFDRDKVEADPRKT